MKYTKFSTRNEKIALQRIQKLFRLAEKTIHEDEKLAQRYIEIARRISMASKVSIPREHRRYLCKGCKKFILPGINCRIRIRQCREPHVVITCGYCNKHMRYPIKSGDMRYVNAKNEKDNKT